MTDIGSLVDELIAAGASPAAAARIVAQAYVAGALNADKRSPAAVRQQRYRDRKSEHNQSSQSVTKHNAVTSDDSSPATDRNVVTHEADTVSLSPVPPSSPPYPPNNPLTPNPIPKTNSRGTRLPENHTMSGPDLAYALSKGMTDREAGDLFERFCSWAWSASGPNAVKRNWHQAWQGWVQREVKDRPRGRPPPVSTVRPLTEFQRKQAETNDVRAQLRSAAMGGSSGGTADGVLPDDYGERSGAVRDSPGSTLLLLPEETR